VLHTASPNSVLILPVAKRPTVFTRLFLRDEIVKLQIPDLCNPDLSMLHWLRKSLVRTCSWELARSALAVFRDTVPQPLRMPHSFIAMGSCCLTLSQNTLGLLLEKTFLN